ncbi:hypothetical protein [Methanothrix harundinacea]|jgi:hypothetical protein|uniref:Uncharacterized protein n=1 Tax=Methanothrix harundinacea (strain 6Ac) TaxID=1110509 RepID=G7WRK9_METH6|nr:hypothetical protein [Methanothrix harundinacea]AET65750.1 hypothetical protein Mhar_2400 [Methanothrix harundinacea 6Ac]
MKVVLKQFKPFLNQRKESGLFTSKGRIEAPDREIAARIEADHDRPGWW